MEMEKALGGWLGVTVPELVSFMLKSGVLLILSGTILWIAFGAHYAAVHDTMHNFRHALAVVPCH